MDGVGDKVRPQPRRGRRNVAQGERSEPWVSGAHAAKLPKGATEATINHEIRTMMSDSNRDDELYEQGRIAIEAGDFETAHNHLQRSAEIVPHFKTLELLGEVRIQLGDYEGAIVPLAAATALNRGVRAPSLLAEVFWHLGDTSRAVEMAREALSRDPKNRRALAVLQQAHSDK